MTLIELWTGPKPNRCKASAAVAFGFVVMVSLKRFQVPASRTDGPINRTARVNAASKRTFRPMKHLTPAQVLDRRVYDAWERIA
jgi:hypothetical protein